jgi:hypothetical protein
MASLCVVCAPLRASTPPPPASKPSSSPRLITEEIIRDATLDAHFSDPEGRDDVEVTMKDLEAEATAEGDDAETEGEHGAWDGSEVSSDGIGWLRRRPSTISGGR